MRKLLKRGAGYAEETAFCQILGVTTSRRSDDNFGKIRIEMRSERGKGHVVRVKSPLTELPVSVILYVDVSFTVSLNACCCV